MQGGVIQVVVVAPQRLVGDLPAVGGGEGRPLSLPGGAPACLGDAQAVDGDVVLVEARFVAAHPVLIDGQVRDEVFEAAAVLGVPAPALEVLR